MMFRIIMATIFCFVLQQNSLAIISLHAKEEPVEQRYDPFGLQFQDQNTNKEKHFFNKPITNQPTYPMRSSFQHDPYVQSHPRQFIPKSPKLQNKENDRATDEEIALVKQYYRHVNVQNKFFTQNFVNIQFIYSPILTVKNFAEDAQYSDTFEQEAFNQFVTQYQENVDNSGDIKLNNMNFGLTFSYGTKRSYSIITEWQAFIYQGRYVGEDEFNAGETNFTVSYTDGDDTVSASYSNVEYIQRTFGIHYNVYIEFLDMLADHPSRRLKRFVPYITGGGGLISQYEFLRFSNGNLGQGGATGGFTTEQDYFNIKPSFGFGFGARYKFTERFSFDMRIFTIQPFSDINLRNLSLQAGGRFYF